MGSRAKKKARTLPQEFGEGDRLSRLPDELIHNILSFVDAKEAVQTSVLSRRWKLIWTSLPFLSFGRYSKLAPKNVSNFMRHVLSNRNHQSHISDLNLCVYNKGLSQTLVEKYVKYAISHNLQSLTLELSYELKPYNLSTLNSKSLKKLTLKVKLEECAMKSDCWDLPALTTLHLKSLRHCNFSDSWFTCLPALRTLCLDGWDLTKSSFSFGLPALTTLCLSHLTRTSLCLPTLPTTVWDFPSLTSIQLDGIDLPEYLSDIFSALINLQNLTLFLTSSQQEYLISCPPQLLNLNIRASFNPYYPYSCKSIVVSAPKLCNFTSFGIFTATVGVPELENVNVRLQGSFHKIELTRRKQVYLRLTNMLPGLGNAKNLTFDLESIKAFNEISNLLVSLPSPFCKLKYVKLPRGFKESSISSPLRSYLLGGSPNATFVTELPQTDKILQIMPVSVTSQNVGLGEPLANPTIELVNSQGIYNEICTGTLDMMVQEDHAVENSVVVDGNVKHVVGLIRNTQGTGTDCASSSRGKKDSGIWHGYEVNSEFVGLLDLIMKSYPETFEHFITKNKKFCTIKLNMLCTSVNAFTTTSMTEIDAEMITEYRTLFDDLQKSFNINWLVSRLNYIEQLQFSQNELHAIDSSIDEAKSKLFVLQNLRSEKMTKMHEAFGTMGTNLVTTAGYIGDDLFSSP